MNWVDRNFQIKMLIINWIIKHEFYLMLQNIYFFNTCKFIPDTIYNTRKFVVCEKKGTINVVVAENALFFDQQLIFLLKDYQKLSVWGCAAPVC